LLISKTKANQYAMPTLNPNLVTRDIVELSSKTGNIYETVMVIAKRARHLSARTKEELTNKLSDFASSVDNLEEVFENREQIEISKFYERMPKPTTIATDEYVEGKIKYTRKQDAAILDYEEDDGLSLD